MSRGRGARSTLCLSRTVLGFGSEDSLGLPSVLAPRPESDLTRNGPDACSIVCANTVCSTSVRCHMSPGP